MKNAIIALSVVLALVVFSEVVLFQKYRTAQKELLYSQQNAESLNAKTIQLDQEIFQLKDQISRNEKQIQELEIEKKRISVLQNEIRSKDQFLSDYQKKLQMATQNLRQERQKTENLDNELSLKILYISKLQEQIEDGDVLVSSLKKTVVAAQARNDALRGQNMKLTNQKERLLDKVEHMKSIHDAALSELREELKARDARIESLEGGLEGAESQVESLKTQLSSSQAKISELLNQAQDLAKARGRLKNEFDKQKSSHEKMVSALRAGLQGRDSKIADLQDELKKAGVHMQFLEETNSFLRKEIVNRNEQILTLTRELDALKGEIERQQAVYSENVSNLNEKLQSENLRIHNLQEQIVEAEAHINSLKRENVSGQTEIDTLRNEVLSLNKSKENLKNRFDQSRKRYEAVISELKANLQDRDAQTASFGRRLKEHEMLVISLKEQVLSNESKAEALRNQIIQLQKEKDKLEADNEKQKLGNKELISKLQEEIENREHMIQKLRNQLNRAEELALSLGKETKKGQSRQNKLRKLLSELKQKEDQHKTKIYQLQSDYTAMISELKNEIDTREVTIQKLEEKLSITFVDRILFDKGKSTISPQGRKVLNKVGTVLKNVQNRKIRVIGHTDNIPIERKYRHIFPSNWELSAARAAAVVRYFQYKMGLDPINLEVVGRSFYDAVASNDTQEERSKNRRVNIIIAPKLE